MSKYTLKMYAPLDDEGTDFRLLGELRADVKSAAYDLYKLSIAAHPEAKDMFCMCVTNSTGAMSLEATYGSWVLSNRLKCWLTAVPHPQYVDGPITLTLIWGSVLEEFEAPPHITHPEEARTCAYDLHMEWLSLIAKYNDIPASRTKAAYAQARALFGSPEEHQAFEFGKRAWITYKITQQGFKPVTRPSASYHFGS